MGIEFGYSEHRITEVEFWIRHTESRLHLGIVRLRLWLYIVKIGLLRVK